VPTLDAIRLAFASRQPSLIPEGGQRRAGVAMVLRDDPGDVGPSVLFIERARWEGDPWSGHMAFPGGRVDPGDRDARAAAERETLEEVGLRLDDAEFIGRLDDRQGNPRTHRTLVISGFVYAVEDPPELTPNHEVEKAFWFPLRDLLAPDNHVPYTAHREHEFPGILVGDPDRHIVWGLTYSFLEGFFSVVGKPLPDRWTPEMRRFARRVEG
jgi:8-oxo-dGTP pyrophosphatase MutT (NUDIX family)